MRWLMVADFVPERASGAAGSLLAIGDALQTLGAEVDYRWRPDGVPHAGTARDRHGPLPRRQLAQVVEALASAPRDVVVVSQPWAWRVYTDLPSRHPATLFLNRTHGWEARLYAEQRRLGIDRGGVMTRLRQYVGERLAARACRRTARAAHGVIAAAALDAAFIRDRYDLPPDRVTAVTYGADDVAPPAEGRSGVPRLLFVGHYLERKGAAVLSRLLPALALRHPAAELTFVTDAGAHPVLERQYRTAWGGRLAVHAWMPREELRAIYAQHDILVYPTLFEGFGKTWLEAMRAGCCVVGFAEGGLPDIATHARDALICPAGDEAGLALLLDGALADIAGTRRLGRAAAARTAELTWARTAAATVAFVERLREHRGHA